MKKVITVNITVDEDEIKQISKKDKLEEAITSQLTKLNECGMNMDFWKFQECPTVDITVCMDVSDKHKIFDAHQILTFDTVKRNNLEASVAAILKNRNGMNVTNMIYADETKEEIIVSLSVSKEDLSWDTGRLFGKAAINDALDWMAEDFAIDYEWYWAGQEPLHIQEHLGNNQ